jgi:hypothetical protein
LLRDSMRMQQSWVQMSNCSNKTTAVAGTMITNRSSGISGVHVVSLPRPHVFVSTVSGPVTVSVPVTVSGPTTIGCLPSTDTLTKRTTGTEAMQTADNSQLMSCA